MTAGPGPASGPRRRRSSLARRRAAGRWSRRRSSSRRAVRVPRGTKHLVLVDAERPGRRDPAGVHDERRAVTTDKVRRCCPADPEGPCRLGHGVAVFADTPAGLLDRPTGEAPFDRRHLLREALGRTVGIAAQPPALAPHQARRSSPGRQVGPGSGFRRDGSGDPRGPSGPSGRGAPRSRHSSRVHSSPCCAVAPDERPAPAIKYSRPTHRAHGRPRPWT